MTITGPSPLATAVLTTAAMVSCSSKAGMRMATAGEVTGATSAARAEDAVPVGGVVRGSAAEERAELTEGDQHDQGEDGHHPDEVQLLLLARSEGPAPQCDDRRQEHAAAVEARDRQQVEDGQREVDDSSQQHDGRQADLGGLVDHR